MKTTIQLRRALKKLFKSTGPILSVLVVTFIVLVRFAAAEKNQQPPVVAVAKRQTPAALKASPKPASPTPTSAPVAPAVKPGTLVARRPAPIVHTAPHSSVTGLVPQVQAPAPPSQSSQSSSSTSPPNTAPASQTTAVNYTSSNWAGYMATSGSFTAVSGSWVVPSPAGTGTSEAADAAWVGIGGVSSNDLIQAGTFDDVSNSGQVTISAFYEVLPSAAQFIATMNVSPGDAIATSLREITANVWSIGITDQTNNQSFVKTVTYASSHSSAEWIEEDPSDGSGQLVPFDNFHKVSFNSGAATVNGSGTSIAGNTASSITLVNAAGQPLAVPSPVSGGSFSVTRTNG